EFAMRSWVVVADRARPMAEDVGGDVRRGDGRPALHGKGLEAAPMVVVELTPGRAIRVGLDFAARAYARHHRPLAPAQACDREVCLQRAARGPVAGGIGELEGPVGSRERRRDRGRAAGARADGLDVV